MLREKLHESLAEVSGAVEIEPDVLASIERGQQRPSEEVLLLLISYLDPKEEHAAQLWDFAGYSRDDDEPTTKPIIMLMQPDNRIMYSDMVNVVVNQQGVVVNFLQTQTKGKGQPVARVGMSQQQALQVIRALQQSLLQQHMPKALPAPDDSDLA